MTVLDVALEAWAWVSLAVTFLLIVLDHLERRLGDR